MNEYITSSVEETKQLAAALSGKIKQGVIALTGDLGAGKTTFVQGFARGLGIKEKVISPTFIIVRQHKIPGTKKMLFHIDLYRLEDENSLLSSGIKDLLNDPKNLVLVEWAEKAKKLLSKKTIQINFETLDSGKRKITLV